MGYGGGVVWATRAPQQSRGLRVGEPSGGRAAQRPLKDGFPPQGGWVSEPPGGSRGQFRGPGGEDSRCGVETASSGRGRTAVWLEARVSRMPSATARGAARYSHEHVCVHVRVCACWCVHVRVCKHAQKDPAWGTVRGGEREAGGRGEGSPPLSRRGSPLRCAITGDFSLPLFVIQCSMLNKY